MNIAILFVLGMSMLQQQNTLISSTFNTNTVLLWESIDIPAIKELYLIRPAGTGYTCHNGQDWCEAVTDQYESRWTCKDKSRALEHSVDETKWWCHMPQI